MRCVRCVNENRKKRKRQPIGMLGRSSGNNDWLLANASACVSCGFRLRNTRNASNCFWMETGLTYQHHSRVRCTVYTKAKPCSHTHIMLINTTSARCNDWNPSVAPAWTHIHLQYYIATKAPSESQNNTFIVTGCHRWIWHCMRKERSWVQPGQMNRKARPKMPIVVFFVASGNPWIAPRNHHDYGVRFIPVKFLPPDYFWHSTYSRQ